MNRADHAPLRVEGYQSSRSATRRRRSLLGIVVSAWPRPPQRPINRIDRDRGAPRGAAPPTPPGIRVAYHGGSIGLSRCRNIESGETE
jgi:hypothetical protein